MPTRARARALRHGHGRDPPQLFRDPCAPTRRSSHQPRGPNYKPALRPSPPPRTERSTRVARAPYLLEAHGVRPPPPERPPPTCAPRVPCRRSPPLVDVIDTHQRLDGFGPCVILRSYVRPVLPPPNFGARSASLLTCPLKVQRHPSLGSFPLPIYLRAHAWPAAPDTAWFTFPETVAGRPGHGGLHARPCMGSRGTSMHVAHTTTNPVEPC